MNRISRREFVSLAAGAAAAPLAASDTHAAAITAQDVVDRIRRNLGVAWRTGTVDTFKAGDPATVATGIVTTATPTLDVLRRAVKAGANLVITCGPTFYARADAATPPQGRGGGRGGAGADGSAIAGRGQASRSGGAAPAPARDPVFAAKNEFIGKHNLVVWRFSDHWRLRAPDPFSHGLVDALGWSAFRSPDDPARVAIPEITLGALASHVKATLRTRGGIRVVGMPDTKVQRIAVLPGSTPIQASLRTLPAVDAIVAGEVREWESVEYVRDTVAAGGRKGLILVGRVVSEDPAMSVCAQWLGAIVPELATTWIPAGDPYWRPI